MGLGLVVEDKSTEFPYKLVEVNNELCVVWDTVGKVMINFYTLQNYMYTCKYHTILPNQDTFALWKNLFK